MSATIALLGQPNSGKSTLFNALTGLRQHVGNWPGKTVEKKEGTFTHKGDTYSVADLPGSYSMSANSDEEVITRDFIASGKADIVCILADSSQLKRSLFMLADYTHKFWEKPAVVLTVLLGLLASFIPALPIMGMRLQFPAALKNMDFMKKPIQKNYPMSLTSSIASTSSSRQFVLQHLHLDIAAY